MNVYPGYVSPVGRARDAGMLTEEQHRLAADVMFAALADAGFVAIEDTLLRADGGRSCFRFDVSIDAAEKAGRIGLMSVGCMAVDQ